MKKGYLVLLILFFLLGCSKKEVTNVVPLPKGNFQNLNSIEGIEYFNLTFEQGENVDYYTVDDIRVQSGTTLNLPRGSYSIKAFTIDMNNGTKNIFLKWNSGYRNSSIPQYYLSKDSILSGTFINTTLLKIYSVGTKDIPQVEVEGYGTYDISSIGGPFSITNMPTNTPLKVTVITPSAYEFIKWHDGSTDIQRTLYAIPFDENNIYFKKYIYWQSNGIYERGDRVSHNGKGYEAMWTSVNEEPGTNTHNAWAEITLGDEWSSTKVYLKGDIVTYNNRKYIASWWSRGTPPDYKHSGFLTFGR